MVNGGKDNEGRERMVRASWKHCTEREEVVMRFVAGRGRKAASLWARDGNSGERRG